MLLALGHCTGWKIKLKFQFGRSLGEVVATFSQRWGTERYSKFWKDIEPPSTLREFVIDFRYVAPCDRNVRPNFVLSDRTKLGEGLAKCLTK